MVMGILCQISWEKTQDFSYFQNLCFLKCQNYLYLLHLLRVYISQNKVYNYIKSSCAQFEKIIMSCPILDIRN